MIPIRNWLERSVRCRYLASFQPSDGLDEVLGGASPNPERSGCPGEKVIQTAAKGILPLNDPVYDHLGSCSECYRELRVWQASKKQRLRVWPSLAAAAVLIMLAGGVYVGRNRGTGREGGEINAIVLDYQDEGVSRNVAGDAVRRPRSLPRRAVTLTVLMPTGSEAGSYELRLVRRDGNVSLSGAATAAMTDFSLRLEMSLDLRSLEPGLYTVQTRRVGEDWDSHPVVVQ